jgi:hypothetical protein
MSDTESPLQPDPPPTPLVKKTRIGCGAIFGLVVGLFGGIYWFGLSAGWLWGFAVLLAIVCAVLALRYGDRFWFAIVDSYTHDRR